MTHHSAEHLEDTMVSPYVEPAVEPAVSSVEIAAEEKRLAELGDDLWRDPTLKARRKEQAAKNDELIATATYSDRHIDPTLREEYATQDIHEAKAAHDLAKTLGEDYRLTSNTAEKLITMLRAVGVYGEEVAEKFDLNPEKVVASRHQLTEVLGNKLRTGEGQADSVDASTYMLTALSLAHMQETSPDEIERTAAHEAWEALHQQPDMAEEVEIVTHPESLKRVKLARALGPWVGEMAAHAVVRHHLEANTTDLVTIE